MHTLLRLKLRKKTLIYDITDGIIIIIDGIDLILHDEQYYQTDGLHTIDSGFGYYANNLWEKIN